MIKKLYNKHKEIVNYIFFGGLTTLVNWLTYSIFVKFAHININISNIIAWVVSVLFAYCVNKMWVFNNKQWNILPMLKEFLLFVSSRTLSGALEIFALPALVFIGLDQQLFGVDGFFAKIIISIIVVILNYITGKFIVFKQKIK